MTASVNQAKIVIPTGFESQQRQLERKQAIAQALLEKGLAGPGNNATSWVQPLASVVQALAGRHLQDRTDKQQGMLDTQIKDQYTGKVGEFNTKVLQAGDDINALFSLAMEAQKDPMLADLAKPIMERAIAAQKGGDSPTDWGPYRVTNREAMTLGQKPNDPNSHMLRTPSGDAVINQAELTRALLAQNMVPSGAPPMTVQDPLGSPEARLSALRASQDAGSAPIPLPPNMTGAELPALPQASPQNFTPPRGQIQDHRVDPVTGKHIYQINGQWYDNPEGR